MSIIITPLVQISAPDANIDQSSDILAQTPNVGIVCTNDGAELQVATLPSATSALALPFPIGVTTALILAIFATGTSDLYVNVGASSPQALLVPAGQALLLYNIAKTSVSVSSVLGGKIKYIVGG